MMRFHTASARHATARRDARRRGVPERLIDNQPTHDRSHDG